MKMEERKEGFFPARERAISFHAKDKFFTGEDRQDFASSQTTRFEVETKKTPTEERWNLQKECCAAAAGATTTAAALCERETEQQQIQRAAEEDVEEAARQSSSSSNEEEEEDEEEDLLNVFHSALNPALFSPSLSFTSLCTYAHGVSPTDGDGEREKSDSVSDDARTSRFFCFNDKLLLSSYISQLRQLEQWRFLCVEWEEVQKKRKEILKQKIRNGIPDCMRGRVWHLLARLPLHTIHGQCRPGLYARILQCGAPGRRRKRRERRREGGGRERNEEKDSSNVSYEAPFDAIIARDINRTFPKHVLFRDLRQGGQQALFNVLRAYAIFNPTVGYCQGMGFLSGVLLLYVNEEEAFHLLIALLSQYGMEGLFTPGLPTLEKYFFQFKQLLQKHMPRLSNHFRDEGVEASMYISGWLMTLFAYNFPIACVVRIWDIFFREGEKMLFRTALAILSLNEDALLRSSFESILHILKSTPSELDADVLVKKALSIKVTTSMLKQLEEEYLQQKCGTRQSGI